MDSGQLSDAVERAYDRGEALDWELVFELSRRVMAAEAEKDAGDMLRAFRPAWPLFSRGAGRPNRPVEVLHPL